MRSKIFFLTACFFYCCVFMVSGQSESYLDTIYQANDCPALAGDEMPAYSDGSYYGETLATGPNNVAFVETITIPGGASATVEIASDTERLQKINGILDSLLRILMGKITGVAINIKIIDCVKLPPVTTGTSTSTSTSTITSTSTSTSTVTSTSTSTSTVTSTSTSTATATSTSTSTATATSTGTGTVATPGAMNAAIDAGNVAEIKRLIAAGIDLDWRDSSGRTYLMRAVNFKVNESVQALIDGGAKLDSRDSMNMTALHYCATQNNAGAVPLLVRAGLKVDIRGFDSQADGPSDSTALHLAAQANSLEAATALINAGADVNALTNVRNGTFRRSPLFWAEKSGNTAIAELLKQHGAVKYPAGATNN